jgi:1-aminocyclopropane-1-carboxylate deaminase/D-cysteine desulfhydrase-like pyridoxal-dependent ACC family enzyme
LNTETTGLPFTSAQVSELIGRQPRVPLALLPTPLQEARTLTKVLGGPRIFIKRDDLTGPAFGGNKTRNLEFRLVSALEAKAEVLIMALEVTSNSARQTVATANTLGMETVLVLKGERPRTIQGNLLVNYLLGADVRFARDEAEQNEVIEEVAEELRRSGRRPMVLTSEPIFDIGSALAYLECTVEVVEQLASQGAKADYLYMTSGGKGQAGLVLGKKLLAADFEVHGITVSYEYDVPRRTAQIANDAAAHLGLDVHVGPEEVVSFDHQVGPGYGHVTESGLQAIALMARTEGIILDPIYTGKCFAALVDHVRQGILTRDHTVVFIHTGGTPAIFSHASELMRHLGVSEEAVGP